MAIDPSLIPFLELSLALLLGMLIGIERSIAHKEAGMRTFGLVALGACFFTLMPKLVGIDGGVGGTIFDPFRIAAAIITGIGFLGGGLIIYDGELKGLTTAAGLWVSAGVGMAVGFGLYTAALFATFLMLIAFTAMWYVERYIEGRIILRPLAKETELVREDAGERID